MRVLIGPANYSGQAFRWARALESLEGVGAVSMGLSGPYSFGVDYEVSMRQYLSSSWARAQQEWVAESFTHVVIEAGKPILGLRFGVDSRGDFRHLQKIGMCVCAMAHGSDLRLPSEHAERFASSPFRGDLRSWRGLERRARHLRRVLHESGVQVLVSTPDLLVDWPTAHWCPVVVDAAAWATSRRPLMGSRPVVVHAPTSGALKGSARMEPQLKALDAAGVIQYRALSLPHSQLRDAVKSADIIVDQVALGSYGVSAVEGMASGRIVLGAVDPVRQIVRDSFGVEIPIIETKGEDVADVILEILQDPTPILASAESGPAYAALVHSGKAAAAAFTAAFGQAGSASDNRHSQ